MASVRVSGRTIVSLKRRVDTGPSTASTEMNTAKMPKSAGEYSRVTRGIVAMPMAWAITLPETSFNAFLISPDIIWVSLRGSMAKKSYFLNQGHGLSEDLIAKTGYLRPFPVRKRHCLF